MAKRRKVVKGLGGRQVKIPPLREHLADCEIGDELEFLEGVPWIEFAGRICPAPSTRGILVTVLGRDHDSFYCRFLEHTTVVQTAPAGGLVAQPARKTTEPLRVLENPKIRRVWGFR